MPFDGNAGRSAPIRTPDASAELPIEARIIDEALTILGSNGEKWIQGSEADSENNYCMIGAIELAQRRLNAKSDHTACLIINEIRRNHGFGEGPDVSIMDFNDEPGRSFEEVRETFLLAKCEAIICARRGFAGRCRYA